MRDESVAQHQVGGNRSEQLLINPEFVHVDEFDVVPLRDLTGARDLFGVVFRGRNETVRVNSSHITFWSG